jgi:ApbE superfamily uncharacterized protein (UPF0280 family)
MALNLANSMYQPRKYRNLVEAARLLAFRVVVKETDLLVHAEKKLEHETRELVLEHRGYVEAYIKAHPDFFAALTPLRLDGLAATIVVDMVKAGENAGVGPMAAIAGAVAEHAGLGLLKYTDQVIVENGGDVFIKTDTPLTVGIFAGKSPLSLRIGIRVGGGPKPMAVCTSSGTVGHSLSLGKADAVCVVADSCSIADAAATAIGNQVQSIADIEYALARGKCIGKIRGIIIIVGGKIGIWGDLEVVPLKGKNA